MKRIVRLAKPEDYKFNHEINLYELSFDKRPVKGVRCEDPQTGAQQYNTQRLRFMQALEPKWKPDGLDFSVIIRWALERGTVEQCQLVWDIYHCTNDEEYNSLSMKLIGSTKDSIHIVLLLTGRSQRIIKDIDLLKNLDAKREAL